MKIGQKYWSIMKDDIIINKTETIKRCLDRIREEYLGFEDEFYKNYTKQDSIILNIERMAQASIDIASHIVRVKKLGVPQSTRETFDFLLDKELISQKTHKNMSAMVSFRNIAVHDYQTLNLEIVVSVLKNHLDDFKIYIDEVLKA